jgi:hypothetical protein
MQISTDVSDTAPVCQTSGFRYYRFDYFIHNVLILFCENLYIHSVIFAHVISSSSVIPERLELDEDGGVQFDRSFEKWGCVT